MMYNCKCGNQVVAQGLPCPEGLVGCLVFHYDPTSLICSKCGEDHRQAKGDSVIFVIDPSASANGELVLRDDGWVPRKLSVV